jgi:hypothetical protein
MLLKVKLSELMLTWLDANDIEFDGTINNDYELTLKFEDHELSGTYSNLVNFVDYYSNEEEGDN